MREFDLPRASRWSLFSLGVLTPLVVSMLFVAISMEKSSEPVVEATSLRCDPLRVGEQCGRDHCVSGECVSLPGARQAREVCTQTAHCAVGWECHAARCQAVDELPVAPPSCRLPEVEAVLQNLRRRCSAAAELDLAESSLRSCSAEEWEEISKSKHFERQLLEIPGSFAVFFGNGEPGEEGPSSAERGHFLSRVRRHGDVLSAARVVLVIGRASATGGGTQNRALAGRRASVVASIVDEVRGERRDGENASLAWGLADNLTLSANLVRPFFVDSPIAASEDDEEELRALGADLERTEATSEAANRMALIVPLPCDSSEYFPRPSFPKPRNEHTP